MYLINFIALCFLNQYFSVYLYQFLFSFAHFPVYFSSLFDWMDSFSFFLSFFTCIHCYKKVSHSVVPDSATPWTVAHQAPLVHGVLQARILEWVAILFSRGSSQSRDRTWVSSIAGRFNSLPSEPPGKSHCYIFTYLLTFFGCAGSSLLPAGFL